MSVDKKTVKKIAHLARIALADDKLEVLAGELSNILAFVEQLSEVDTDQVEPMTSAVEMKLHWRADQVTDGAKAKDILANASGTEFGFFAVPKVLE